jgi:hypothetical protein
VTSRKSVGCCARGATSKTGKLQLHMFVHAPLSLPFWVLAFRRSGMDPVIRAMVTGVNGPLLLALAGRAGYHDAAAVELFRGGAPLVGALAVSGPRVHSLHKHCVIGLCRPAVEVVVQGSRKRVTPRLRLLSYVNSVRQRIVLCWPLSERIRTPPHWWRRALLIKPWAGAQFSPDNLQTLRPLHVQSVSCPCCTTLTMSSI